MGGTNHIGYFSKNPKKLRDDIRKQEINALDDEFTIGVKRLIGEQLASINDRDEVALQSNLDRIVGAISKTSEGAIQLMFGGSLRKRTYVEGLSDIDALILIDAAQHSVSTPQAVRARFVSSLREELPLVSIKEGKLAITIEFSPEIQLLPAIASGDDLLVSDAEGALWVKISPERFIGPLVEINQQSGGRLVTCIKLAKLMVSQLPPNRQLTGYHLESLAVQIFSKYTGRFVTKDMLLHFFEAASEDVLSPIADPTGQSIYVDDRLGVPQSLRRRIVSDALSRIARRMQNADGAKSLAGWAEILGVGK